MQVSIVNVMKFPSTDPKRIGQMDTLVIVRTDGKAVTTITIPKDTSDKAEIEKAVAAELQKRSSLVGHTFEVK